MSAAASEVAACISLAIGMFGAACVPYFLLVDLEHLVPRVVREAPATARAAAEHAALTAAVLLLLLSAPEGAAR